MPKKRAAKKTARKKDEEKVLTDEASSGPDEDLMTDPDEDKIKTGGDGADAPGPLDVKVVMDLRMVDESGDQAVASSEMVFHGARCAVLLRDSHGQIKAFVEDMMVKRFLAQVRHYFDKEMEDKVHPKRQSPPSLEDYQVKERESFAGITPAEKVDDTIEERDNIMLEDDEKIPGEEGQAAPDNTPDLLSGEDSEALRED